MAEEARGTHGWTCFVGDLQNDPPTTRSSVVSAPSLTQYSSNVYDREDQVVEGVAVMGEARYFK